MSPHCLSCPHPHLIPTVTSPDSGSLRPKPEHRLLIDPPLGLLLLGPVGVAFQQPRPAMSHTVQSSDVSPHEVGTRSIWTGPRPAVLPQLLPPAALAGRDARWPVGTLAREAQQLAVAASSRPFRSSKRCVRLWSRIPSSAPSPNPPCVQAQLKSSLL